MDQEMDVQLYITCRLCLKEPGSYQIVPRIKGQIKYCFGININPFDGLPQLICKKCKGNLSEYYSHKNLVVQKQIKLQNKLLNENRDAPTDSVQSPTAANVAPYANGENLSTSPDEAPQGNSETSAVVTNGGHNLVKSADATDDDSNPKIKKGGARFESLLCLL